MNLARHYRTLGLRRGASSQEVKAAYRTLVRQYHPDINPDEAAVEQFIKINDAYTVLCKSIQLSERKRKGVSVQSSENHQAASSHQKNTAPGNAVASPHVSQASNQPPVSRDIDTTDRNTADRNTAGNSASQEKNSQSGLDERLQTIRQNLEKLGFDAFRENDTTANAVEDKSTEVEDATAFSSEAHLRSEAHLKQDTYQQLKELLKQQKFPRAIALIEGLAHRIPHDAEIVQWQAIVYQRWGRHLISEGQISKARIYLKKALRTDPNNRSLWREVNRAFWQLASLGQ